MAIALIGLLAAGCSEDAPKAGASRRVTSTTSTSIVVGSKVIGGGTVSENQSTTFSVDGGAVTVLVPVGAVTKGTEVQVREVTSIASDLGAIQRAGKAYDLSFKNGKLTTAGKIALSFDTSAGAATASTDDLRIGGVWDDATGRWVTATDDPRSEPGKLVVYALKPGKYTWLKWSRDRAVLAGTDAIRTLVGPVAPASGGLKCTESESVRSKFDLQTNVGSALSWCVGRENGRDALRVLNSGQAPLTLRYKGFDQPKVTHLSALTGRLYDALAPYWDPVEGESVSILGPADEAVFPVTGNGDKGMLRAELNGFTQHFDVVSAAVAFTAGYYAGNAALAADLLDRDQGVRNALVASLAGQGCANGLGNTVDGGSYATDKLAEYAALLVDKCLDDATAKLVVQAAQGSTKGQLLQALPGVPARSKAQIDPALRTALSPLVEPVGGPVAGEIIMSPRTGTTGAGTGTTTGAGTDDAFTPTGTAAPTPVTVAPTATTTAPPLFATTTQETAPPSATTAATAAPTTSTTVTPTTRAATTTTTRATTTTTAAPATTTTVAPATTTTTAAPSTPLVFELDTAATCASTGGTLRPKVSGSFTPGTYAASFWSPSNAFTTSSGTARADGTIDWTFPCTGKEPGQWKVQISQGARQTAVLTFPVRIYDTSYIPLAERVDLPICSGSEGGTGASGAPGGTLSQTFVVNGPTLSRIVVTNREEFVGTYTIRRNSSAGEVLATGPVVGAGEPNFVILPGLVAKPGEVTLGTLVLEVTATRSTAASPNKSLNFWRSTVDVAAGVSVSIANTCPWNPGPAVVAGTDLVAYIEA